MFAMYSTANAVYELPFGLAEPFCPNLDRQRDLWPLE